MVDSVHFRNYIVRPVLRHLSMWSESAENLMVGTALAESHLIYLTQLGNGPALGVMQMEPMTHDWLWNDYLQRKKELRTKIRTLAGSWQFFNKKPSEMIGNLNYAVAMARIKYWTIPEKLPSHDDIVGLSLYWKKYYNSEKGKGNPEEFVKLYLEKN